MGTEDDHEQKKADGNFVEPSTTWVDRAEELSELRALIDDGQRTVALVGPPGSGKSRLAAEFASRHSREELPGGAWFVDVSGCSTREDVLLSIASTRDLALDDLDDAGDLLRVLGMHGPHLLVLDAFDRLADTEAVSLVEAWPQHCPEGVLLVTSRVRVLGVAATVEVGALDPASAVELFEARAGASADQRELVEKLVDRLDRLPLAIELAASRAPVLGPADLLDRLDKRFALLRERGRALEHAVEWSWDALDDAERRALVQTTVFAAPFTIDDAEAVASIPDEGAWVVDLITALVERSLLRRTGLRTGKARFAHYESVREYVRSRPQSERLLTEAAQRHRTHFAGLPARLIHDLDSERAAAAVTRIEGALPELTRLFERLVTEAVPDAIDLVVSLVPFLERSARGAVYLRLLDAALDVASESRSRARLLLARGELRVASGDLADATHDLTEASRAAREASAPELEAFAAFRLGDVERRRGRPEEAMMLLGQALELAEDHADEGFARLVSAHLACCRVDMGELERARELIDRLQALGPHDDDRREAEALKRLSYAQFYLGNYEEQHRLGEMALRHARRAGDRRLEALCIHGLGDSALQLDRPDEARVHYEEALEMHREMGDRHYEGILLGNLGTVHHRADRFSDAGECYREALEIHRRAGAGPYEAVVSFALGVLEAERGRLDEAEHHYVVALELDRELELEDDVGAVQLARAWLTLERGERKAAKRRLADATEAFERSGADAWRAIAKSAELQFGGDGPDELSSARKLVEREGGDAERALLELLELVAGPHTEAAQARIEAIRDDPAHAMPPARWSLHVRALRRLATRGEGLPHDESSPRSGDAVGLRVEAEGRWFEAPGGERVDLRRRRSLRLVLQELVRRAVDGGEDLDVYEAFDVGWPGEKASVDAASDRVYWAIRTLRKLGLQEVIVTSDQGYHLDPGIGIEVVES